MDVSRPARWVADARGVRPDAPAVVVDDRTVTYAELDALAARTARSLIETLELGPLGRLGVAVTGDAMAGMTAMWAAWRLGAAVMPLDPRLPELMQGAAGRRERFGLAEIITRIDPADSAWAGAVEPAPADLHSLVLTSGSTAHRKAVRLTHGNVAAAVAASHARLGNDETDRWLLCLPLFHVGGLSILWRSAAAGGAAIVHGKFDPDAAAAALRSGTATLASFVPTMLQRVLDADPGPYRSVKAVLLGGAPAPDDLVRRAVAAGLPVLVTYGMTETCSQIATVAPGRELESLGTVGRPLQGADVSITSDGVIAVEGPMVSPGYDGEPDRTGPLLTNDLGDFDSAGRLVVLGRRDDVLITGGENVHPDRVEAALRSHPAVEDCLVYGLPDPEWGERVAATVVLADHAALPDVAEHAAARLAGFEVPTRWRRADRLPQLATGKPDRAAARRAHEEER